MALTAAQKAMTVAMLAAAVPAEAGSRVLELGSGTGIAALCLAKRVPDLDVLGIEIDPGSAEIRIDGKPLPPLPDEDVPLSRRYFLL